MPILSASPFSWQEGEAWYLPFRAPERTDAGTGVHASGCCGQSCRTQESPRSTRTSRTTCGFTRPGYSLLGIAGDPVIADYLMNAGERSHEFAGSGQPISESSSYSRCRLDRQARQTTASSRSSSPQVVWLNMRAKSRTFPDAWRCVWNRNLINAIWRKLYDFGRGAPDRGAGRARI